MTREEAIKYLIRPVVSSTEIGEIKQKELDAYNMAIEELQAEPLTIPMFAESAEAYKAWTGEEMGKTDDLISRKKVLNVIKNADVGEIPYAIVYDVINGLPTVSADRPQGEWINQDNGAFYPFECSNCHEQPFCDDYGYLFTDYCPNCGALMLKGGDSE